MNTTDDGWEAATYSGAADAQADAIARLSATERAHLLEQLLELAIASGALQRARAQKQRELDAMWSGAPLKPTGPGG